MGSLSVSCGLSCILALLILASIDPIRADCGTTLATFNLTINQNLAVFTKPALRLAQNITSATITAWNISAAARPTLRISSTVLQTVMRFEIVVPEMITVELSCINLNIQSSFSSARPQLLLYYSTDGVLFSNSLQTIPIPNSLLNNITFTQLSPETGIAANLTEGTHYYEIRGSATTTGRNIQGPSVTVNREWIQLGGRTFISQPPGVTGDPHVVGLDGSVFDFNGISGRTYSLISSPGFQYNAQFVHSESYTYIGEVGVRIGSDLFRYNSNDQLYHNETEVNVIEGEWMTIAMPWGKFHKSKENFLIETRDWKVKAGIVQDTATGFNFVNIWRVTYLSNFDVGCHGIIGQTVRPRKPRSDCKNFVENGGCNIEGIYTDYDVQDGIYGTQFVYSRFHSARISEWRKRKALAVTSSGCMTSHQTSQKETSQCQ